MLSEIDQILIERCLSRQSGAWEEFVDRFAGLVMHVIQHTSQNRSIRLNGHEREDLAAEIMLAIIANDFSILRRFRGQSSLSTYLAVIARRVAARRLVGRQRLARLDDIPPEAIAEQSQQESTAEVDQLDQLLQQLGEAERMAVEMHHLQGRSYQDVSAATGITPNSVGPTLSRARNKMRSAADENARRVG